MKLNRFFLREQPAGSLLDSYVNPWPEVQKCHEVMTIHIDQCMAGLVSDTGIPIQKKTEWTSNTQILLTHLQKHFQCDHSHKHFQVDGKGKALSRQRSTAGSFVMRWSPA